SDSLERLAEHAAQDLAFAQGDDRLLPFRRAAGTAPGPAQLSGDVQRVHLRHVAAAKLLDRVPDVDLGRLHRDLKRVLVQTLAHRALFGAQRAPDHLCRVSHSAYASCSRSSAARVKRSRSEPTTSRVDRPRKTRPLPFLPLVASAAPLSSLAAPVVDSSDLSD